MENFDNPKAREDVFSRVVKAGKRTYFFDVKATRKGEYYLIVTESKKSFDPQSNQFSYEKHKIFVFQEDLEKFRNALQDIIEFADEHNPRSPNDHPAES
ncbi:MAG TPA: DNA-binding protein [Bacteroidales bacterium]|nr:DNA-binding protein [Bacteroidales bacterium]